MAVSIEVLREATRARPWANAHLFRLAFAGLLAALIVAGFTPSVFAPLMRGELELSPLMRAHAAVFFGWVALLMVQIALVATRRVRWHRTLGAFGALLAASMVVMGVRAALALLARDTAAGNGHGAQVFLLTPLLEITVFALLVGSAIALRKRVEWHKRLMLVATVGLVYVATGRLSMEIDPAGYWTSVATDGLIVLLMLQDKVTRGAVHPAYWIGLATLLLTHIAEQTVSDSAAWLAIAGWIATL